MFSCVNLEGVLIWEAGIPAVKSTTRGRIFVEQRGKTSTGVAIANVLPFDTVLTLVLRDRFGVEVARVDFPIEGNGQRALFIDQIFEDLPPSFIGSLTFETADESHKVATVTVRGNTNARNEALFATLDVIDLADRTSDSREAAPHPGPPAAMRLRNQAGRSSRGILRDRNSETRSGPEAWGYRSWVSSRIFTSGLALPMIIGRTENGTVRWRPTPTMSLVETLQLEKSFAFPAATASSPVRLVQ